MEISKEKILYDNKIYQSKEMKILRTDIKIIVLTAKYCQQKAESVVQEMAHCAKNRTSKILSTAMVAGWSLDNRWVTMELDKILTNTELRGNQHIKKGKNGHCEHISENSKRRAYKHEKNGQIYKSHLQPNSRKYKLLIK